MYNSSMQVKPKLDQNALSRQLAVFGHEAQGKLMAMRVYIHGITGLGIETVKNLVLAGPKQVALFDNNHVTITDLGRNFYFSAEDVGKRTRAEASLQELKDLNPQCKIDIAASDAPDFISSNFDVVVVHDNYNQDYLASLNQACRSKNVGFILAGNLGLYGYTFVDFGDNHIIVDPTGEEAKIVHVAGISKEEKAVVCCHEKERHNLSDGDTVLFREVKGMHEINGKEYVVNVISPYSFTIGSTVDFSPYETAGQALQIKKPILSAFKSFLSSLTSPYAPGSTDLPIANWEKFDAPGQFHVILKALYSFVAKNNNLPQFRSQKDLEALTAEVNVILQGMKAPEAAGSDFKIDEINPEYIRNIAHYAKVQVSPCCSFWGGIVAQEIIKKTGKYTPIRQWLHSDFFEAYAADDAPRTLTGQRYDDYIAAFGDAYQAAAIQSRTFMIGAGALGCEFIKMFALMGLGSSGPGQVTVTDDDNIEISNLNRQFLFRREHVGSNKCETACKVAKKINNNVKFDAKKLKVGKESEVVFDEDFWESLDVVVNAVDNVNARKFVDRECVWFGKPLFESGTLGTKCHSQIILPKLTQSYSDIIDQAEQEIPLCTLKNFPYQIEHTIQWARDYFEGLFSNPSADLNQFWSNSAAFVKEVVVENKRNPQMAKARLDNLWKIYNGFQARSYTKCVEMAVQSFHFVLRDQIFDLLRVFPADSILKETGKLYWSGLKRVPSPIQFNPADPSHLDLVQATANIFATLFNLPMENDKAKILQLLKLIKIPAYIGKKLKVNPDGTTTVDDSDQINEIDSQVQNLAKLLSEAPIAGPAPTTIQFEKDDPTNFHVEFLSGVSNLRARNYKIEEVEKFKVKLIAGKIIPAIATTTAMIVGAVGIQIVKYLLKKPLATFKNVNINLALPLWVFSDPVPPIEFTDNEHDELMGGPVKAVPGKFNKWDKIIANGPMVLQDLVTFLETTYNISVSMITFGSFTVYSTFGQEPKKNLPLPVPTVVAKVTKEPIPPNRRYLNLMVSGNTKNDGVDCLMPDLKYRI